jgi:hypothetical protein
MVYFERSTFGNPFVLDETYHISACTARVFLRDIWKKEEKQRKPEIKSQNAS